MEGGWTIKNQRKEPQKFSFLGNFCDTIDSVNRKGEKNEKNHCDCLSIRASRV